MNHLVRFGPLLELIGNSATGGTLLDVGSGSQGIASLLGHDWQTTMVDADFADYGAKRFPPSPSGQHVVGDVRALPFADQAFDVVVASDLLEHVPPQDRDQAIREICRVARRQAIIACPCGEHALNADQRLADQLSARHREIPPWLSEHLVNGFPRTSQIERTARSFGRVRLHDNENLTAHVRLVRAELSPLPAVLLRLLCRPLEAMLVSSHRRAAVLSRELLRAIRGQDRAPVYRAMVVVEIASPAGHAEGRQSLE
jgi:ubiquinone/menaquinone biosynthesis C-methylase UbiE